MRFPLFACLFGFLFPGVIPRAAASTHTWTGAGGNALWSNASNWSGGKPTSNEAGGTVVSFGALTTSTCDIAGLVVDQILFTGGGNTINGSTALTIKGTVLAVNIQNNTGSNTLGATLPLVYSASTCNIAVAGLLTIAGNAGGSFGLQKLGVGTLSITGKNTYTGTTTVAQGMLSLNSGGLNNAVPGNLNIGTGTLGPNAAIVQLLQGAVISDTSQITVETDGLLDVNGFAEIVGSLSVAGHINVGASPAQLVVNGPASIPGGTIETGTGRLTLNNSLAMTGGGITATGIGLVTLGGNVTATSTASSAATITGNVALNGTRIFTVNGGNVQPALTLNGIISEAVVNSGITKLGNGTLQLLGPASNTFKGITTIDRGMVQIKANSGRTFFGPLVIGNANDPAGSAVLQELINNDIDSTVSVIINPSGVLDMNGFVDTIGALSGSGSILLPANSQLNANADNSNTTFSGAIVGGVAATGAFRKSGTGTLLFKGTFHLVNRATVNAGTLTFDFPAFAEMPAVLQVGDSAGAAGSTVLHLSANNQLSPSTALEVKQDGLLDMNNTVAQAGNTSIIGGSIAIGTGQLTIGNLTMTDGSVSSTGAGALVLGGNVTATGAAVSATISGTVSLNTSPLITVTPGAFQPEFNLAALVRNGANGPQGITKSGTGTMRFGSGVSNTFTGTFFVEKGTAELNNSAGVTLVGPRVIGNDVDPANTAIVKDLIALNINAAVPLTLKTSGLLDLNGFSERCNTLTGTGNVSLGVGKLTVGQNHGTSTFDGIIAGTGGLTKDGKGVFTLTRNNPFSGSTQIFGGRLIVNGVHSNSAVTVFTGGSLGGTGAVGPSVTTTAATATVNPGNTSPGNFLVSGSVNLTGGRLAIRLNDSANPKNDHLDVTGNLNLTGATIAPIIAGPVSNTPRVIATYGSLTGTFTNVPSGFSVNYAYNDGNSSNHIAITVTNPWLAWLAGYGLDPATTGAPGADADKDGLPNGVEFVLGTDPTQPTGAADLPDAVVNGSNLVFSFRRSGAALFVNPVAQISTSLSAGTWTDVNSGIATQTGFYGPGIDKVTVTIPRANRTSLFCRLKVVIP